MIEVITWIVLGSASLGVCVAFRNDWVWEIRRKLLLTDYPKYTTLWGYNRMVLSLWIWDIEKMRYKSEISKSAEVNE